MNYAVRVIYRKIDFTNPSVLLASTRPLLRRLSFCIEVPFFPMLAYRHSPSSVFQYLNSQNTPPL